MNYEKPPAGGGERVWVQNSTELAHLHFHFQPRSRWKVGEHSPMVTIMQEIYLLFIKWYVLTNISKWAHNSLLELLAHDMGIISIIHMLVGVTGKCCFWWKFDRQLYHWLSPFSSLCPEYRMTKIYFKCRTCTKSYSNLSNFSLICSIISEPVKRKNSSWKHDQFSRTGSWNTIPGQSCIIFTRIDPLESIMEVIGSQKLQELYIMGFIQLMVYALLAVPQIRCKN